MTRLLGTGDEIIPLSQEEVELLLKLGKEEQLVAMSTGIIENDQVRITHRTITGHGRLYQKNQQTQKKSLGFHRYVWKERGYGGWVGNSKKSMRKEGETKEGVCIEKNHEDGINTRTLYF